MGLSAFALSDSVDDGINAAGKGNYKQAEELFKKACDGGYAKGCSNLGVMYDNGYGVKQDSFKAVELWTKACDGGNVEGCSNLGIMYSKG